MDQFLASRSLLYYINLHVFDHSLYNTNVDLKGSNLLLEVMQFNKYPPFHLFCSVNRVSTELRSSSMITLAPLEKTLQL
jgi:hypothetical protein